MNVLLTMEAVLRHVQTLLDHLFVVAKVDTLLLAMDSHVMVWTDSSTSIIFCDTLTSVL